MSVLQLQFLIVVGCIIDLPQSPAPHHRVKGAQDVEKQRGTRTSSLLFPCRETPSTFVVEHLTIPSRVSNEIERK